MTIVLNEIAIDAACTAARAAIDNYSSFDSSMVPDDALRTVVTAGLTAAIASLNAQNAQTTTAKGS
jgi:hypothetical protein